MNREKKAFQFSHSRLRGLAALFLFCLVLIAARLFQLQIASADYWREVAAKQHGGQLKIAPLRGEIQVHDRKTGQTMVAATTAARKLVYAVPEFISSPPEAALKLEKILSIPASEIESKLWNRKLRYVALKRSLSDAEVKAIEELNLSGIRLDEEQQRFYPYGEFLSSTLGFVGFGSGGEQRIGLYGLERTFENELAGREGKLVQDRASRTAAWIFGGKREFEPAQDGESLLLTVDLSVQRKAEEILKATLEKHHARQGCVIVLEPQTGAILALASGPSFNLNEYSKVKDTSVYNNVCLSSYEPGSVFKPLTMAASLDAGEVTPDTVYTDPGFVSLDGFTIKNSDGKAHGETTMTQVLEKSLNTGAIFAQNRLGNARFVEAVKKFGFGQETKIELPESVGNLKNLSAGGAVHYATASFGQGISVTPLQMASAIGAVANKGVRMQPHIVQSRIAPDGTRKDTELKEVQRVISSETATSLAGMLVSVVEKGHGHRAKIPNFSVAGKTGTAQVVLPGGKGYDEHKTIGTFVGFAPAFAPRFVVLVRIDEPTTVQFAENTAAPAFGELMRFLLDRFNVEPDRL